MKTPRDYELLLQDLGQTLAAASEAVTSGKPGSVARLATALCEYRVAQALLDQAIGDELELQSRQFERENTKINRDTSSH